MPRIGLVCLRTVSATVLGKSRSFADAVLYSNQILGMSRIRELIEELLFKLDSCFQNNLEHQNLMCKYINSNKSYFIQNIYSF